MTALRLRRLLPVGVAVAGVVGAHALNYVLAFPDPAVRTRELASTGHGYWPIAVAIAFVAAAMAASIGVRDGLRRQPSSPLRVTRLAALQVALFVGVETVERVGAGVDPRPFLHSPQLLLGIVLQVVVAVGAVLLLRAIEAGARRVARALRHPFPRAAATTRWALSTSDVVSCWWSSSAAARAPPALALT